MPSFRRSFLARALGATIAIAALAAPAGAMSVSPVQLELTSAGKASRAQLAVSNPGTAPLTVETTLQAITLNEDGHRKTSPAGDEFLVFPPQAIIPPGGTQVFRVQWVGEPELPHSKSFMLMVAQVPVKLPAGKPAVQVVFSMGAMINVKPPLGQPALRVVASGVTKGKDGKRHPYVTLENPTNVHALLPDGRLHLAAQGWSRTLDSSVLAEKIGIGLVEPGKRRRFTLPIDIPPAVNTVQASLDYKPRK
jgi:P pilus assembly chaperone PapD